MANYIPDLSNSIAQILLTPTKETVSGVLKKTYPTIKEALSKIDSQGKPINLFFGTFKTYGGTERDVNGVYSIEDTANVETWFRPDIKGDCRIALETGEIYDIIGEPENINMRNQFLKFKVRRVKGGV